MATDTMISGPVGVTEDGALEDAYARLERAARKPSLLSCPWTWEHDYVPCGQCDACVLRAAIADLDEARRRQCGPSASSAPAVWDNRGS